MNEEMPTNQPTITHTFEAVCFANHDNCRVAASILVKVREKPDHFFPNQMRISIQVTDER